MIILLMGVTGSGKTTVGSTLALRLGWVFADADDFHSIENKQKMAAGMALNDEDRGPWLEALRQQILTWVAGKQSAVLACSALKQSYRAKLLVDSDVRLIYLRGSYELIASRLTERVAHYATESILASQFATLEEPAEAITIDVSPTVAEIANEICNFGHCGAYVDSDRLHSGRNCE